LVWVVVGLVAVAVLIALIGGIGAALPKAHSVSRRAQFNRSPQDIWRTITDYQQQVTWRKDLRHVERLPNQGGLEAWRETDRRRQALVLETVESVPPRRLVRRIANDDLAFSGSWTFDVEEVGEITVVTVTEDGEVYNPFFRFIGRVIMGQTATVDGYLKALGEKLGVEVTITSV
jgi:uncharacterized protein YndB with AHSA1/START domain